MGEERAESREEGTAYGTTATSSLHYGTLYPRGRTSTKSREAKGTGRPRAAARGAPARESDGDLPHRENDGGLPDQRRPLTRRAPAIWP